MPQMTDSLDFHLQVSPSKQMNDVIDANGINPTFSITFDIGKTYISHIFNIYLFKTLSDGFSDFSNNILSHVSEYDSVRAVFHGLDTVGYIRTFKQYLHPRIQSLFIGINRLFDAHVPFPDWLMNDTVRYGHGPENTSSILNGFV